MTKHNATGQWFGWEVAHVDDVEEVIGYMHMVNWPTYHAIPEFGFQLSSSSPTMMFDVGGPIFSPVHPIRWWGNEARARRAAYESAWVKCANDGAPAFELQDHEYRDTGGIIRPKLEGSVYTLMADADYTYRPPIGKMKLWQPRGKVGMGFKHPREAHYNPLRTATWTQRFAFVCWFETRKRPSYDFPSQLGFAFEPRKDGIRVPLPKPNEHKPAPHLGVTISEASGGSAVDYPAGFFPQGKEWYDSYLTITITESSWGSAWRGELREHWQKPCYAELNRFAVVKLLKNAFAKPVLCQCVLHGARVNFLRKKALIPSS